MSMTIKRVKIINFVYNIMFILFIISLGITGYIVGKTIQAEISNSHFLYFFGESTSKVVSGSMEPLVMTNDVVNVRRLDRDDDIVVSTTEDDFEGVYVYVDYGNIIEGKEILIMHRCIGIDENGDYVFKGDANLFEDTLNVPRENIIAKVTGIAPHFSVKTIASNIFFTYNIVYLIFFFDKRKKEIINKNEE